MMRCDALVTISPEQRFDASVPVPTGSSFDVGRRLVALADQKMYEAKRAFAGSPDAHIAQVNVRVLEGKLVEILDSGFRIPDR